MLAIVIKHVLCFEKVLDEMLWLVVAVSTLNTVALLTVIVINKVVLMQLNIHLVNRMVLVAAIVWTQIVSLSRVSSWNGLHCVFWYHEVIADGHWASRTFWWFMGHARNASLYRKGLVKVNYWDATKDSTLFALIEPLGLLVDKLSQFIIINPVLLDNLSWVDLVVKVMMFSLAVEIAAGVIIIFVFMIIFLLALSVVLRHE